MTALAILDKLQPEDLGTWGFGSSPVGGEIGGLLNYTGIHLPERRVAVLKLAKKLDPSSTQMKLMRKDIERLRDDDQTVESVREAARAIQFAYDPIHD